MSFSDFKTLESVIAAFGNLSVTSKSRLFSSIQPIEPSQWLQDFLSNTVDLASTISTEKARSELIITPILLEIRSLYLGQIGYFSGTTFNVDEAKSLTGVCDFLLTASPNQVVIESPVVAIVEAKDNDIRSGLGQCAAEMVAASIFNDRQGSPRPMILGLVSTGTNFRFLALKDGNRLEVDLSEYLINQLPQILGILAEPFK